MFSKIFNKYITYLYKISIILIKIDLRLKKRKLYFFYLNITLLETKINAFKLIIIIKKLKKLINLIFLANLVKFK